MNTVKINTATMHNSNAYCMLGGDLSAGTTTLRHFDSRQEALDFIVERANIIVDKYDSELCQDLLEDAKDGSFYFDGASIYLI